MTVVQPNSISGINSITVQSGEGLSIHKSDGSLIREIVSAAGIATYDGIKVGSAATISSIGNAAFAGIVTANSGIKVGAAVTVDANTGNVAITGIITASSFSGVTATTINNNADNRLITGSGTADTLNGEANLTFDGNDITQTIDADAEGFDQTAAGNHYIKNIATAVRTSAGAGIWNQTAKWNTTEVAAIKMQTGPDTTNKDDGIINFHTTTSGGSMAERLRIDSSGRLLVNQTAEYTVYADSKLQISATDSTAALSITRWSGDASSAYITLGKSRGAIGAYTVVQDDDRLGQITFAGADGTDLASSAAGIAGYVDGTPGSNDMPGRLVFFTASDGGVAETERMRITSDGTFYLNGFQTDALDAGGMKLTSSSVAGESKILNLRNPDTGADSAVAIVYNMDRSSGGIHFQAAKIACKKKQLWTGTASTVDSYLQFYTIRDESTTEKVRIGHNLASVYIYKVTDEVTVASSSDLGVTLSGGGDANYNIFTANNNTVMYIGRQTSDGNLLDFRQAGAHEGSISVSGSTVSYNGGHLARWSQIPGLSNTDVSARPTIYRGTVMSNLDEMCEWTGEENLQLNKTQVSTASSDPNVAGIFWEWDDNEPPQGESHDYKNDFFIAMTGDTIIRVGAGVSVTKGDLLESAGDGTARPQSDDIIRSKTVAKVTSNVGIVTYADNSYCVPCLLMAC